MALCAVAGLTACGSVAVPAATPSTTGTTSSAASGAGRRITVAGSQALEWGTGPYGVVLAHGAAFDAAGWEAQAVRIAAAGMTVVAVEDISPDGIQAAVDHLHIERGPSAVALLGGSAGADAILELAARRPDVADQLILLSPNEPQAGLGPEPKLLIASEGEPLVAVARDLAASAAGPDNQALILPGSAHAQNIFGTDQAEPVMRAILDRLARFGST